MSGPVSGPVSGPPGARPVSASRRAALRVRWLRLRRTLATSGFRTAMRVLPPAPLTLVAGLPDREENSLVTALRVRQRSDGRVVLVAADPAAARAALEQVAAALGAGSTETDRVEIVPKADPRTALLFLRAGLVFYTHGLYDSPRPAGRRLHVNLWHGTGPKWTANAVFTQRVGAQAHVAAASAWGAQTALSLGMRGAVLVTGNPRQDLLGTVPPGRAAEATAALGLDPGVPFVLWLPTFRSSARAGAAVGLEEGQRLADDALAARLAALAREHGAQLVVKPHRLDADRYAATGAHVVDDGDLERAGLTLTQFAGLAAGMLSDYSSAWVDYLPTGRPVALYCPDLDRYVADRGFNQPPLDRVAAGLLLHTTEDAAEFFAAAASNRGFREPARARLVREIGADVGPDKGQRLLDDVRRLGLARFGSAFGISDRRASAQLSGRQDGVR